MSSYVIFGFTVDFWTVWGFVANGLFFGRFLLQWYASEKQKKIVIPHAFWHISLVAALMVGVYGWVRRDIVFVIAAVLQVILFSRNLVLSNTVRATEKAREG